MRQLKNSLIIFLSVALVGSIVFYNFKLHQRDKNRDQLLIDLQNEKAKGSQLKIERDSSYTQLVRVRELNEKQSLSLRQKDGHIAGLKQKLSEATITIRHKDTIIAGLAQETQKDTTKKLIDEKKDHISVKGWFKVIRPYPYELTISRDPFRLKATLFVNKQRELAMNWKVYDDEPQEIHTFTEVDKRLFLEYARPEAEEAAVGGWLKRLVLPLEFGFGPCLWANNNADVGGLFSMRYEGIELGGILTTKSGKGTYLKYNFKPF